MSNRDRRITITTFALTVFNSWVLFEETLIDRLGWWRYLPCYRPGRFCEWDAGAIVVILLVTGFLFRKRHRESPEASTAP